MNKFKIQVNIKGLSVRPTLNNYGAMIDDIEEIHCEFECGKIYGIIGECGSGGWGLSYILSGKESLKDQEVFIDGKRVSQEDLKEISWYVGEGLNNSCRFSREKTIHQQLQYVIRNRSMSIDEKDIIEKFYLSPERLNCRFSQLSWERWRASAAIGYAYGRKIFCFPWLSSRFVNLLILNGRMNIYTDILKSENAIIIIPTENQESLEHIADEFIIIDENVTQARLLAKRIVLDYIKEKEDIDAN